jgi:hypothetical protein
LGSIAWNRLSTTRLSVPLSCYSNLQQCKRSSWARIRLRCLGVTRPDEDPATLIHSQLLGMDDVFLEVFQLLIIQVKSPFERPIGHSPLALDKCEDLLQHLIKVHGASSSGERGSRVLRQAWTQNLCLTLSVRL